MTLNIYGTSYSQYIKYKNFYTRLTPENNYGFTKELLGNNVSFTISIKNGGSGYIKNGIFPVKICLSKTKSSDFIDINESWIYQIYNNPEKVNEELILDIRKSKGLFSF